MSHKLTALVLTLVSLITLLVLFTHVYKPKHSNNESFVNSSTTLTDPAETIKRNRFAVSKCDVLLSRDSNVQDKQYDVMSSTIHGYRINEWKPDPLSPEASNLRQDRVYCYMYNDSSNNIQDFNLQANDGLCAKTNPMFSSSMITNVFSDSRMDQIHKFPVEKCVLEIDPASTSPQELNSMWASWTSSHCDNMSGSLRRQLVEGQDKLRLEQGYHQALQVADSNMVDQRQILTQNLQACGLCNVTLSNTYWTQQETYLRTQRILQETQQFGNRMHSSNQSLIGANQALVNDRRKFDTLFIEEEQGNRACQSNLGVCNKERDFALFRYNESYEVNQELDDRHRKLSDRHTLLSTGYGVVSSALVECDREKQMVTNARDEMVRNLMVVKDNLNKCTIDRTKFERDYKTEDARLKDITQKAQQCTTDRKTIEQVYNKLIIDISECQTIQGRLSYELAVLQRQVEIETKLKERAEQELRRMRKNHEACIITSTKNEQTIGNLRETNVQLYTELERANVVAKQMVESAFKEQSEAIACASKSAVNAVLEATEQKSKSLCELRSKKYDELALAEAQVAAQELKKEIKLADCGQCKPTLMMCVRDQYKNPVLCNKPPQWTLILYRDDYFNYTEEKRKLANMREYEGWKAVNADYIAKKTAYMMAVTQRENQIMELKRQKLRALDPYWDQYYKNQYQNLGKFGQQLAQSSIVGTPTLKIEDITLDDSEIPPQPVEPPVPVTSPLPNKYRPKGTDWRDGVDYYEFWTKDKYIDFLPTAAHSGDSNEVVMITEKDIGKLGMYFKGNGWFIPRTPFGSSSFKFSCLNGKFRMDFVKEKGNVEKGQASWSTGIMDAANFMTKHGDKGGDVSVWGYRVINLNWPES